MKQISKVLRVLSCAAGAAVIAMFLFDFILLTTADGATHGLNGLAMCFGSQVEIGGIAMATAKSAKYLFAFVLSAIGLVTGALSFKFKGSAMASAVFQLAASITYLVFVCNHIAVCADLRPFKFGAAEEGLKITELQFNWAFWVAFIASVVGLAFMVIAVLLSDRAEAKNGKTIPKRIVAWFKGVIGEIRKIVWPGKNSVVKNTIIVLAMCVLIGAFIWIVDFGFAKLLGLIFNTQLN